jgi:hypothetical protein
MVFTPPYVYISGLLSRFCRLHTMPPCLDPQAALRTIEKKSGKVSTHTHTHITTAMT